jgi:thiol:disulfide interchange protein DsbA
MTRMFTLVSAIVIGLSALTSSVSSAQEVYREGEHYELITPAIKVGDEDEVVVTEFFWYGCGHCFSFEPMLDAWEKQLPEGVRLEGAPSIWRRGPMEVHAKAYFIAKALGMKDKIHLKIFEAMHLERKRLGTEAELRAFFVSHGADPAEFDAAYDSFGVNSQVRRAESHARSARISGTPSMMVAGKYRVETRDTGGQSGMLKVVDYLVQKELAAIKAKKGNS